MPPAAVPGPSADGRPAAEGRPAADARPADGSMAGTAQVDHLLLEGEVRMTDIADITRLEDERYAAMVAKDIGTLERLLHPALVYMHSSGVADDKALYAWVPQLIRYYLGEDPILRNVPTWVCADPPQLEHVLAHLEELVVKPVGDRKSVV